MLIKTKEQYEAVLIIIEMLMDSDPDLETAENDALNFLVREVEEYEYGKNI